MSPSVRTRPSEGSIPPRLKLSAGLATIPVILLINFVARAVTDAETAGLVAAAIPGVAIAAIEYLTWKRRPRGERIQAAIDGTFYRHPAIAVVYIVVALQVLQPVLGFLVGFGIGFAAVEHDLSDDTVADIATTAAEIVGVPVVAVAIVFIARLAAHRIREHQYTWVALGLALDLVISVGTGIAFFGADDITALDIVGLAIRVAMYFGAAWIGVRWAQRTQALHVLGRAYRNLSPENRVALVELAMPKVQPESVRKA